MEIRTPYIRDSDALYIWWPEYGVRIILNTVSIQYIWHSDTLHIWWAWIGCENCDTLQYTAIHCNTLQYTATHCNTIQHATTQSKIHMMIRVWELQHTAKHCITLQHTAPYTWWTGCENDRTYAVNTILIKFRHSTHVTAHDQCEDERGVRIVANMWIQY